jgi:AmmeMemoRadiSam system protein A
MNEAARKRLLQIARQSVAAAVQGKPLPKLDETDPELQGRQGCFVTLKNGENLRGCLGHFTSAKPLWKLVNETARASATEDPRFWSYPITPDELGSLNIEISVLSPLQRIANPLAIELGVDGIYIRRGAAAGCFLPQVATETGWSKEEFLSHCCSHKAGLSADAWRDPGTEVLTFRAEVFGESE